MESHQTDWLKISIYFFLGNRWSEDTAVWPLTKWLFNDNVFRGQIFFFLKSADEMRCCLMAQPGRRGYVKKVRWDQHPSSKKKKKIMDLIHTVWISYSSILHFQCIFRGRAGVASESGRHTAVFTCYHPLEQLVPNEIKHSSESRASNKTSFYCDAR